MTVVLVVALLAAVALGVTEVRRWAAADSFGAALLRTLVQLVWRLLKVLVWLWASACRMVVAEVRSW